MLIINEDTRLIIGSVAFVWLLVVCVVIAVIAQRKVDGPYDKKAELRRQKEQEARDSELFDNVEEYRRDFDDAS